MWFYSVTELLCTPEWTMETMKCSSTRNQNKSAEKTCWTDNRPFKTLAPFSPQAINTNFHRTTITLLFLSNITFPIFWLCILLWCRWQWIILWSRIFISIWHPSTIRIADRNINSFIWYKALSIWICCTCPFTEI